MTLHSLIPLMEKAARQCERVAEVAQKRTTSAHDIVLQKAAHQEASDTFEEISQIMRPLFPSHWGMDTWGFHLLKDGETVRWARAATGKQGLSINADESSLIFAIGFLSTLAQSHSEMSFEKDNKRLRALKLSGLHPYQFRLKRRTYGREAIEIHTAKGNTPLEAFALLVCAGAYKDQNTLILEAKAGTPTDDASLLEAGKRLARDILRKEGREWSASLALFQQLKLRKDFRALLKHNIKCTLSLQSIKTSFKFFDSESVLVTIKRLLDTAQEGENRLYAVTQTLPNAVIVTAWDPFSAKAAHHCLYLFSFPDKFFPHKAKWTVFDVSRSAES